MSVPRLKVASGVRWSVPVITGVVAAVVLVGIGFFGFIRVVSAVFEPSADPKAENAFDSLLAQHTESLAMQRKRFEGRSIFWPPPPPPAPLPPIPPKNPDDDKPKPPPPKPEPPSIYSGTKVMACIGGSVYFTDGTRLSIGDEGGGIKVIDTNPPWDVTLRHLEKDYVVSTLPDSDEKKFFGGSLDKFGTSSEIPAGDGAVGAAKPVRAASTTPPAKPAATGGDKAEGATPPVVKQPDGRTLPPEPEEGAKPPAEAGAEGSAEPSTETPPRSTDAPPALTKEQIDEMDKNAVNQAMTAVTRARLNRGLDEATKKRLSQELTWLQARVKALGR